MELKKLFTPYSLGPQALPNRIVMAPMTRSRAGQGNVPGPLNALYYTQRASAGLIITEATQVTPEGQGYISTPGIHSDEQVEGWKLVTKAVHDAGGRIFLQLWHVGRISHPSYQPNGQLPVSASAIAPEGNIYTPQGMKPFVAPRALDLSEIPGVVQQYRAGAQNALEAGFDGVEIHAANGYLIDQFLEDGSNKRTDAYGGPIQNRARFMLEVTKAVIDVWGKDRVGIRLSPGGSFNSMSDSNTVETFSYAVKELDKLGLVYVHIKEAAGADLRHGGSLVPAKFFRPLFKRTIIANTGYTGQRAEEALNEGAADLIAFGVPYLANPDLPYRLKTGAPLNAPDQKSFYGGTEKGYTDYPALETART
jgi:N-ethylmaleimide reductase